MKMRSIILVTDGDDIARAAVETAAKNIGARCIAASAGNPTPITGEELKEYILRAPADPVVVMVDDRGQKGKGRGEAVVEYLLQTPEIQVLGIAAVSSQGRGCDYVQVDSSVARDGKVHDAAVDKDGYLKEDHRICGDTLSVLQGRKDLVVIGMGDPGKMDFRDEVAQGAPITTRTLEEIVLRSGFRRT